MMTKSKGFYALAAAGVAWPQALPSCLESNTAALTDTFRLSATPCIGMATG